MKKITIIIICLIFINMNQAFCQSHAVSISDDETYVPENAAMLDITSTTKGVLLCRMTYDVMQAIEDPAEGLLVYVTDINKGYWFYNSDEKEWVKLPVFEQGDTEVDYEAKAGTVIMYSGQRVNFTSEGIGEGDMEGWALCDGQGGRPNLTGSFIIGAGNGLEPTTESTDRELHGSNYFMMPETHLPQHSHNVDPIEYRLKPHKHNIHNSSRHIHMIKLRKKGTRGDKQIANAKSKGDTHTYYYNHSFRGASNGKLQSDEGSFVFPAFGEDGLATEEWTEPIVIEADEQIELSENSTGIDQENIDNRPKFFVVAFVIKL